MSNRVPEELAMNALALEGSDEHWRRLQETAGEVVATLGLCMRLEKEDDMIHSSLRSVLAELQLQLTIVEHSLKEPLDSEMTNSVHDLAERLMTRES